MGRSKGLPVPAGKRNGTAGVCSDGSCLSGYVAWSAWYHARLSISADVPDVCDKLLVRVCSGQELLE